MKRLIYGIIGFMLLAVFAFGAEKVKMAKIDRKEAPNAMKWAPDKLVIKLEIGMAQKISRPDRTRGLFGVDEIDKVLLKYGVTEVTKQFPGAKIKQYKGRTIDLSRWYKLYFQDETDIQVVLESLQEVPGIEKAQPVGIHRVYATPNDPSYPDQWHLNQSNDHDMDAPEAWDVETGDGQIIVGIMDTGVRYFHKDLGGVNASYNNPGNTDGNIWINTAEKNGQANVDDDGNGFVDDWVGWDFVTGVRVYRGEDGQTPDNDPRDFNGHGTHVAGIIASMNNNGYAVSSTAGGWSNGSNTASGNGVKIMPLRIGWSQGFWTYETGYVSMDFAAEAFYYAADNGAKLINCSWGSSNSGGLADAVDYFLASGGMVFHAAGNGDANDPDYLDNRSDIISVASTDQNDVKSSFSNYGAWVDISAPGTDILSTYHNHNDAQSDYIAEISGTSMATPAALSVAALIWSQHPDWTAAQVEQHLYDTADDIDGINSSYAGQLGAGRVNAFKAVEPTGPTPPTAAFTGSPASGCVNTSVQFSDESSGDIDTWSWDFGDGNTSSDQNPTHTYTSTEQYTVTLEVTGPGGSDTEAKTDFIEIVSAPVADFTASPLTGDAPLTVDFTDQSTGAPTSREWDFGDGGTSTDTDPSYEYTEPGTYTVELTVSNACNSSTETKTAYIEVTEPPCVIPVADFTASPTSGNAPLTVSFTDQSTNDPDTWEWDFGDGNTSTVQSPSHEYSDPGTYSVTLIASSDCGADTMTQTDYITVSEPPQQVMHVEDVQVTKQVFYNILYRGRVMVRIADSGGNPVSDATVSGSWSDGASGTSQFTTGADGTGTATTGWAWGNREYTFCVDNVSKSGWTYDSNANAMDCGSTTGTAALRALASEVDMEEVEAILGKRIHTNYPNPFNPSTNITFFTIEPTHARVEVYNIRGEKVITLLDSDVQAGPYSITWNAHDSNGQELSSGYYFYRIILGNEQVYTRKMLYMK